MGLTRLSFVPQTDIRRNSRRTTDV
jgi:hypothetical protein